MQARLDAVSTDALRVHQLEQELGDRNQTVNQLQLELTSLRSKLSQKLLDHESLAASTHNQV